MLRPPTIDNFIDTLKLWFLYFSCCKNNCRCYCNWRMMALVTTIPLCSLIPSLSLFFQKTALRWSHIRWYQSFIMESGKCCQWSEHPNHDSIPWCDIHEAPLHQSLRPSFPKRSLSAEGGVYQLRTRESVLSSAEWAVYHLSHMFRKDKLDTTVIQTWPFLPPIMVDQLLAICAL